jgi:hypothetical protein
MSFGKDEGHLANIPPHGGNFIQRAKTHARRPQRSGGGGGRIPHWKDGFKPSLVYPSLVRLVPGAYRQQVTHDGETVVEEEFTYVKWREHVSKSSGSPRSAVCSGGALFASKTKACECEGCTVYWEDYRERQAKKARGDKTRGPNRMSCRDQYSYTVFDYAPYWKMPDIDRQTGQPRMNNNTNQPYYHWETGSVNDPKFQGKEWKQGHLLSWSMGSTYQDVLIMQAKVIGQHCKQCGNMGCITTLMKICGNPQCGQFIYDPNNTTLTTEQQNKIDYDKYTCPQCQQEGYVGEVIECAACTPQGLTPVRAGIFDVDLQVQAVGNPGSQTFLQVLATSEPRPIQISDAKVLETIKPLDLLKKFAPTALERQRQIWNIQVRNAPLVGQQQPQTAVPVGQPPMPMVPGVQQPMAAPSQQYQQYQQPVPQQYQPPQPQPQSMPTSIVMPPQVPTQQQPQPQPQPQQPQQQPQMPAIPYTTPSNTGE